jgi:hypothetical protein
LNNLERARGFSKWFLEFIRNLGVVAVLQAFAEKSDSWVLWMISKAATTALTIFVVSYIAEWMGQHLGEARVGQTRVRFLIYGVFVIVGVFVLTQVLVAGINLAEIELVRFQNPQR